MRGHPYGQDRKRDRRDRDTVRVDDKYRKDDQRYAKSRSPENPPYQNQQAMTSFSTNQHLQPNSYYNYPSSNSAYPYNPPVIDQRYLYAPVKQGPNLPLYQNVGVQGQWMGGQVATPTMTYPSVNPNASQNPNYSASSQVHILPSMSDQGYNNSPQMQQNGYLNSYGQPTSMNQNQGQNLRNSYSVINIQHQHAQSAGNSGYTSQQSYHAPLFKPQLQNNTSMPYVGNSSYPVPNSSSNGQQNSNTHQQGYVRQGQ